MAKKLRAPRPAKKPAQSEKALEKAIRKMLAARGYETIKIHGGPYSGRTGVADLLVVGAPCVCGWIEVKRLGEFSTPLQERFLASMRARGFVAGCCASMAAAESLADALDEVQRIHAEVYPPTGAPTIPR